jgi:hypothetical protein
MLPSEEDIPRWAEDAEKAGLPLSAYIYEMVEKARAAPPTSTIPETTKDREELIRLRRELSDAETARTALETELFTLRGALFMAPEKDGALAFSSELIDLLQDGRVWRGTEIMAALHIDQKNIDAIKALSGQLDALAKLKMVEETAKGWRWADD